MLLGIKKSHFTFMECIAVMVIIIVLTVILMPAAMKARELCKSINCKSNMKTIGEAVVAYANDRQGALPTCGSQPNTTWATFLPSNGYLPTPKLGLHGSRYYPIDYKSVFSCPSQPIYWKNKWMADSCGYLASDTSWFFWEKSHYSVAQNGNIFVHQRISTIPQNYSASKIAFVRDFFGGTAPLWAGCSAGGFNRHIGFYTNYNASNYSNYTVYHGTGLINAVMFDGSAKSIHTLEYSKYSW